MFKKFKDEDFVSTISPIRESVVISRRFFSGGVVGPANNVASPTLWTSGAFSGGLYLAVYDRDTTEYPRQKLYSLAYGYTTSSFAFSGSGFIGTNREEKTRMYKMFAQNLLGNKNSIFQINGRDAHELIFLCINRNIYKDKIMPNGLDLQTQLSGVWDSTNETDINRHVSNYNVRESFGGQYVGLVSASTAGISTKKEEVALCFLEKGIFVIDPFLAIQTGSVGGNNWSGSLAYEEIAKGVSGSVLDDLLFGARHRIRQLSFTNESQMRTSFWRCTAETEEYNYSSNPSYVNSEGRIRVTSGSNKLTPRTYITTIGLTNKNNEIIAVGKLTKPIKKDTLTKVSVTVRLDY